MSDIKEKAIAQEPNSNGTNHLCKKCGKVISLDSIYCNHCGAKQNGKLSSWFSQLTTYQCLGLVLTGIWFVSQLVILFTDNHRKDNKVWLIDTDFSDYYAYGSGEFVFYAIFIPVLLWGLSYIYKLSKKIAIGIIIALVLLLGGCWGNKQYDRFKEEKYLNSPIINRTFNDCTLGDTYSEVIKKVKKLYSANINDSLSEKECIVMDSVFYGNKFYHRMNFYFYKGKLAAVYFRQSFSTAIEKKAEFNNFIDIFESKNYPHDLNYDKYSNSHHYSDNFTKLDLRYTVSEFDDEREEVRIEYYDKSSGMYDDGL